MALFPNQVQAIVFDVAGAHLILAERSNIPDSPALYLKICAADGCQEIVTFSGNVVRINGESFEVLVSGSGVVMLLGQSVVWSSSEPSKGAGRLRIAARALEVAS